MHGGCGPFPPALKWVDPTGYPSRTLGILTFAFESKTQKSLSWYIGGKTFLVLQEDLMDGSIICFCNERNTYSASLYHGITAIDNM